MLGSLINHISSHDQQQVSDTGLLLCLIPCLIPWIASEWCSALFLCQAVSSAMSHHMTNRWWVMLLYFFARQSHQSCLIPWPTASEWLWYYLISFARQSHQSCLIPWTTASEWHCFISLLGSLINHFSSHDQQFVSDTALFPCQAVSSIMPHPMTKR